ncbi:MAG: Cell wall endopeptidase, family [Bacteroidetes bacterium]|nr:Cell wall endopeptidase, family [Bacteroidota bacterium]
MKWQLNPKVKYWRDTILNSYAQIFFSLNKTLAIIIILVTFISPFLGLCGLAAVILTNILAKIFHFNNNLIREGMYGFNALLLGLVLGFEYKLNLPFIIVFISSIFLLLFFTSIIQQIFVKYKLPYLTIPFLLTYWFIYLAAGSFNFMVLQDNYIYIANFKASESLSSYYSFAHSMDDWQIPLFFKSYFKTLSATFFQNSVLAGTLLALGLLYFSRIAFSLTLIGFGSAFVTFRILGLDTVLLTDFLVGSNFIFLAIALGCFYVVPNKWTYLSVILLTPALTILYIGFQKIFFTFQLKSFTTAFVALTIIFISFLNNRWVFKYIQQVIIQYYSPEKTIYKHLSSTKRFAQSHLAKLQLPVWGKWKVSQGYKGKITHLGDWSSALDFVIANDQDKTYKGDGFVVEDYFAYNKPVVAPLDGYVTDISNNVDDNPISGVNTQENWGNTLILDHKNGIFTQLSHLKRDSFKVQVGDYVSKGQIVATCGSSGRSPEPHLHFQVQLSAVKGSKTYEYPISYFIEMQDEKPILKVFEVPKENTIVGNVEVAELLKKSLQLTPGLTLKLIKEGSDDEVYSWTVHTDAYNRTYLYCPKSNSSVWFVNDGVMFYCYDFEGDKKSVLFDFYLATYRLLLAPYREIEVKDSYPLIHFNNRLWLSFQDFFAPFALFTDASFEAKVTQCDNFFSPKQITIQTTATSRIFKKKWDQKQFELQFTKNGLSQFKIMKNQNYINYLCEIIS